MKYQNPFESDIKFAAIQSYNIPLTIIIFTLFMRDNQPDTHILIDIALGAIIAILVFSAYGISILNTILCLIYSGIWTYLTYLFFDMNISWFHSIYKTNWKYPIYALLYVIWAIMHFWGANIVLDCESATPSKLQLFRKIKNTIHHPLWKKYNEQLKKNEFLQRQNSDLLDTNEKLKEIISELNSEIENTESALNSQSPQFTPSNKTAYQKGNMSKPKRKAKDENKKSIPVFDSTGEYLLDEILNSLIHKHKLGKNHGIRIIPQQPLFNYVHELNPQKVGYAKIVNNKNQWTKFDFVIEIRKAHIPLLVIELDGPGHRGDDSEALKQQERDSYKDGACAALDIPILRITYNNEQELTDEKISENYEKDILKHIYFSLIKRGEFKSSDKLPSIIENDEEIKNLVEKRRFM